MRKLSSTKQDKIQGEKMNESERNIMDFFLTVFPS